MKITMYELLGMIKDGKAPKAVKSEGHYYNYNELEKDYYEGMGYDYEYLLKNTPIGRLNDEVEIIEDSPKEKKIPEKLDTLIYINRNTISILEEHRDKINEIIDCLEYLKNKGE